MTIRSVHRVKSLFPSSQFPLHYAWLQLIEKTINALSDQEHLSSELDYVTKAMGSKYVHALTIISDSRESTKLLSILLPLKVFARKCLTSTGKEFEKDCDKIKDTLSKYTKAVIPVIPINLAEQRQAKEQELQAKREISQKWFQDRKKKYVDFPSVDIVDIRRNSRAATVLDTLTNGSIISESDYLWLMNTPRLSSSLVRNMYYLTRAKLAQRQWDETKKPWELVNAIADYRKAGKSNIALELAHKNTPFKFANDNKKLQSALLTTYGGAKRDLKLFDDAIQLGTQAHELTERDYRPCTLIGACNMGLGHSDEGFKWYQKAIERGFKEDCFEQEIRSIYNRANNKNKIRIKKTLFEGGRDYKWLK